jgi:choline kinase
MDVTIRTAVLLVAGIGSRLRPLTDGIPKALVSLGRESILQRLIRQLQECGVVRFVLATGYCEEAVREAVLPLGVSVEYCRNSDYADTQNSVSFACCADAVRDEPIIKLDGDLVLDVEILRRVLSGSSQMLVAVDSSRELDQEAMKAEVDDNGLIRRFGKSIPAAAASAESIGVEVLDVTSNHTVMQRIGSLIAQGVTNRYYEDVYSELIQDSKLTAKALDVAGLRWTEVDTLEDLQLARQLVASSGDS